MDPVELTERRYSERHGQWCLIVVGRGAHTRSAPVLLRDISRGGACLLSHDPIEPGLALQAWIKIPGQRLPIAVRCVARWSGVSSFPGLNECGVAFEALPPSTATLLATLFWEGTPST